MGRNRIAFAAPCAKTTFRGEDIDDAIERGRAFGATLESGVEYEARCDAGCPPVENVGEAQQHFCSLVIDPANDIVLDP